MARRRKVKATSKGKGRTRPGGGRSGKGGGLKRTASLQGLLGGGGRLGGGGFSGLSGVSEGNFAAPSFTTHQQFIPEGLSLMDVLEIDPPGNILDATTVDRSSAPSLGAPTGGGGGGGGGGSVSGLTSLLGGGGGGGGGLTAPTPGNIQAGTAVGSGKIGGAPGGTTSQYEAARGVGRRPGIQTGPDLGGGGTGADTAKRGPRGRYGGGSVGKLAGLSPAEKAARKAAWQQSIRDRQEEKRLQQAPSANQFGNRAQGGLQVAPSASNFGDRAQGGISPIKPPKPQSQQQR